MRSRGRSLTTMLYRDSPASRIDSIVMDTDTHTAVRELAAKQYGGDPATVDVDLPVDQLGIDSLGYMEFLFELEDHVGYPIPQQEAAAVRTLRELAALVDSLRPAANQAAHPAATPPTSDQA
jgi:acyl carrier protein